MMINLIFTASDKFALDNFNDIGRFVDTYPDFQTIFLKNKNELKLLLQLIGIHEYKEHELFSLEFSKYWDLSKCNLPEFNDVEYHPEPSS